jgi:hypothetical protein
MRSQFVIGSPPGNSSQFVMSSRKHRLMDSNRQLARKIEAMERKYDEQFTAVFDAIKRLIAEDDARRTSPKRRIGFIA